MVDGTPVTSGKDVFALPPSWAPETELFYPADGHVVRHTVGGGHRVMPFRAEVPVTASRPEPMMPDLTSRTPRPVLGIASPVASPDGRLAFRALNALWLVDGTTRPRKIVADGYFNSDPDPVAGRSGVPDAGDLGGAERRHAGRAAVLRHR